MTVYYNEWDPFAAAWLRELITAGLLPPGDVDERSIQDVTAADLRGYGQCHFFAGIGGWAHALELAGWPRARPVWTGSCPCQPYSSAGQGKGDADPRNLWPDFCRLIRQCRPQCVLGEQVENAVRHGWLDRVCADLEAEEYAVGSVVLGAHGAGAPHLRHRLFWVAHAHGRHPADREQQRGREHRQQSDRGPAGGLADGTGPGRTGGGGGAQGDGRGSAVGGFLGNPAGVGRPEHLGRARAGEEPQLAGPGGGLGPAGPLGESGGPGLPDAEPEALPGAGRGLEGGAATQPGGSFWADCGLLLCRDGKTRRAPVEPLLFPLAHGVPNRVGLLRGAGNAVVPQVAAQFVQAFLEVEAEGGVT
jgi:DNA (cytosine-5)-methyltransferase 1